MHISNLNRRPQAAAVIKGSDKYPDINGYVRFIQTRHGVYVTAEVTGLPRLQGEEISPYRPTECRSPVFGFHIHAGESCTGTAEDPFADTMGHYNPAGCPHPYHAGDMPPLFGVSGNAFHAFLTDRFIVDEIIGKTVIIHSDPDDFTSQPSGNSGEKIACGKIYITAQPLGFQSL